MALPIVELNYAALPAGVNPIYSYEAKWILDRPEAPLDIFSCPADLDAMLEDDIKETAISAFKALDVRDWCRVDVRLDARGKANILELNPLPGILPAPESNSCFPKAARAAGIEFSELVNKVVSYGL
jgi:D-alanine-D-alanine ligase